MARADRVTVNGVSSPVIEAGSREASEAVVYGASAGVGERRVDQRRHHARLHLERQLKHAGTAE